MVTRRVGSSMSTCSENCRTRASFKWRTVLTSRACSSTTVPPHLRVGWSNMPITDPDVRRQRQAAWERCRQRALKNLARIHYEEYRELLDVERAKEGINKLGYNGRE